MNLKKTRRLSQAWHWRSMGIAASLGCLALLLGCGKSAGPQTVSTAKAGGESPLSGLQGIKDWSTFVNPYLTGICVSGGDIVVASPNTYIQGGASKKSYAGVLEVLSSDGQLVKKINLPDCLHMSRPYAINDDLVVLAEVQASSVNVLCYNRKDLTMVWQKSYPQKIDGLDLQTNHKDKVLVILNHGKKMVASCLDAQTGKQVWQNKVIESIVSNDSQVFEATSSGSVRELAWNGDSNKTYASGFSDLLGASNDQLLGSNSSGDFKYMDIRTGKVVNTRIKGVDAVKSAGKDRWVLVSTSQKYAGLANLGTGITWQFKTKVDGLQDFVVDSNGWQVDLVLGKLMLINNKGEEVWAVPIELYGMQLVQLGNELVICDQEGVVEGYH